MNRSCRAAPADAGPSAAAPDDVPGAVRDKARALYRSRRLMCSEAILTAVNEVFAGGLTERQAVALASALPVGLGGGCLCGALGGAAVALGLTLEPGARSRGPAGRAPGLGPAARPLQGSPRRPPAAAR